MSPRHLRFVTAAAVIVIALLPLVLAPFTITLLSYIGIYAFVALGLVLLTGVGGLLDLCPCVGAP